MARAVTLFRKVLQGIAKHAAKHPAFGEAQLGTCSNTPPISASLPRMVSWLQPSPHTQFRLHVLGKYKMLRQHRSVKRGNKSALFSSIRL